MPVSGCAACARRRPAGTVRTERRASARRSAGRRQSPTNDPERQPTSARRRPILWCGGLTCRAEGEQREPDVADELATVTSGRPDPGLLPTGTVTFLFTDIAGSTQ